MTHWITLVRSKQSAGWEPPEAEPASEIPLYHFGGTAKIDDGTPIILPEPRRCHWCGYMLRAQIVERWDARSFREAIWGAGEHYTFDRPYKTPLKMVVIGYPCPCTRSPPYPHWIVAVRQKKSPGWDDASV